MPLKSLVKAFCVVCSRSRASARFSAGLILAAAPAVAPRGAALSMNGLFTSSLNTHRGIGGLFERQSS